MDYKNIMEKFLSLLYWTMLAACTVGPGTVVTCARAGAEYDLHLIWPLVFASILAYTLLEGTARLTIVSGRSLGECLQLKYSRGRKIWKVGVICWVVAGAVFIGNTLYECNNFAGGMDALYSLPPCSDNDALRIIACVVYGIIVLVLLLSGKVDALGVALGVMMLGMVVLFLIVVLHLGVDGVDFAKGLLPISMPSGSGNIVLSLIGTTSIGFNLFLGGEMGRGKTLSDAQRGIGFSTIMSFVVSVLILIVGSGTHRGRKVDHFNIQNLATLVKELTGQPGIWTFGIGFIAAALSSMLTVPLGAALTADSVFTINGEEEKKQGSSVPSINELSGQKPIEVKASTDQLTEERTVLEADGSMVRSFPKRCYNGVFCVIVLVSVIVIAADADTLKVILIAQVFNGCLLPFFSICLLLCINDSQFMRSRPQKGWSNCFLMLGVLITLTLTFCTLVENAFRWTVVNNHVSPTIFETCKLVVSFVVGVVVMVMLCWRTDLGSAVRDSFAKKERKIYPQEFKEGNNMGNEIV